MFRESPSGFDIHFRVGPWPVTVQPSFWLISVLFGWGLRRPELIASWTVICFVSILVHEMGHATAARAFGVDSAIRLYSFGGLCSPERSLPRWKDLVMSLAGPGAGFLLAGLLWTAHRVHPPDNDFGAELYRQAMWVNLGWGLMNLVPVLPLDGGRVLADVVGARPRVLAWGSLFGALLGVGLGFRFHDRYVMVLFAWFGLQNLGLFSVAGKKAAPATPKEKDALARGWEALKRNEPREAMRLGLSALDHGGASTRNAARDLLAWAALALGDVEDAARQLGKIQPPEAGRALTWALVLDEAEEPARAAPYAQRAFEQEPSLTSARLAVRLLTATGGHDAAAAIVQRFSWPSEDERERLSLTVELARGQLDLTLVARALFERTKAAGDALLCARAHAQKRRTAEAAEWLSRAVESGATREAISAIPELSALSPTSPARSESPR